MTKNNTISQKERLLFLLSILISFVTIYAYNCMTPYMGDDVLYVLAVKSANNFWDLVKQEYQQYININGRAINHLLLRCMLVCGKPLFDVANSAVFVGLTLLIYKITNYNKKWNTMLYLLINIFLWMFGVQFGETILWKSGACNYLWSTTYILGFLVLFNRLSINYENQTFKYIICKSIGLFLFGVVAGWGSENTSGGAILLISIWMVLFFLKNKKILVWQITGWIGCITGFLFMINAPGYSLRRGYFEEEYEGIILLCSRMYKVVLEIKNNFLWLIIAYAVLMIILLVKKVNIIKFLDSIVFFIVFLATCFALILSPTPQTRVYFGAGIFLFIGILKLWELVEWEDIYIRIIKYSVVVSLLIICWFTYFEEGFNVARIYREYSERDRYITAQLEAGTEDIIVPMLRTQFKTKYSYGYDLDYKEEATYWINLEYTAYYGAKSISAIPREEWAQY